MQLNAITRKSAMMALVLFVVMLVAAMVRRVVAPYAIELAEGEPMAGSFAFIVAALLFLGAAVIEGKTLPRTGLNSGYSTLPIPIFALLSFGVVISSNVLEMALVSFAFALAIYLLEFALLGVNSKNSVFFASMLLGGVAIIYPPAIVLLGMVPLVAIVLTLSFRHVLLMVVGYLLPMFSTSYVLWYTGSDFLALAKNLYEEFLTPHSEMFTEVPYVAIAMLVAVFAVLIWGVVYLIIHPDKAPRLARTRRSMHLFLWSTVLVATMLLVPACDLTFMSLLAVPLTILLSAVLSLLPNNHSTIAYWVLLALFAVHLFVA